MKNCALTEAEKIVLDYRKFLKKTNCGYFGEPPYYPQRAKKGRVISTAALVIFAAALSLYFALRG